MTALWVLLALLGPWAAGLGVVRRFQPKNASLLFLIGAGWMIGQVLVMALLYIAFVTTGSGRARIILVGLFVLGILLLCCRRKRRIMESSEIVRTQLPRYASIGGGLLKIVVLFMTVSLMIKLAILACAAVQVPIRGDDAISIWLYKAKVIATLDQLPRDPAGPYYMGGSFPHYPVFISLLAAWTPLVVGGWSESLGTLPWPFFYLNLFLFIAGGCRRWIGAAGAFVLAYFITSLPLLVVHAYRPGYADLVTACFLCSAMYWLLAWQHEGDPHDAILGLVFTLATACTKREGVGLAVITLACTVFFALPRWRGLRRAEKSLITAALGLCICVGASVLTFRDQGEAFLSLEYHSEVWSALVRHLFQWGSFGPAWIALATALALGLASPPRRKLLPAVVLTVALSGFVAGIFLFTPQARFALNDQTPSRLFLQVLPAIILAWGVCLGRVIETARVDAQGGAANAGV